VEPRDRKDDEGQRRGNGQRERRRPDPAADRGDRDETGDREDRCDAGGDRRIAEEEGQLARRPDVEGRDEVRTAARPEHADVVPPRADPTHDEAQPDYDADGRERGGQARPGSRPRRPELRVAVVAAPAGRP
jgi:hypothetical protein